MLAWLARAVPDLDFHHLHDGPEHAKSHLLGALLGPTVQVAVSGGRPVLGTWQSIFLVELDHARRRLVLVQTMGVSAG